MNLVKQKIEALQQAEQREAQVRAELEAEREAEREAYAEMWFVEITERFEKAGIAVENTRVNDRRAVFEAVYKSDMGGIRLKCCSAGDIIKKDGLWGIERYNDYDISYEGRWGREDTVIDAIAELMAEKYIKAKKALTEQERRSAEFLGEIDPGDEAEIANDYAVMEAEEKLDTEALETF